MILKVKKDLVVGVIGKAKKGNVSLLDALKEIFPKTYAALNPQFPKLMIKRVNTKTGEAINRIVLFMSPAEGKVVYAGKGKYPVGHSGTDLKVGYYEDIAPSDAGKIMSSR